MLTSIRLRDKIGRIRASDGAAVPDQAGPFLIEAMTIPAPATRITAPRSAKLNCFLGFGNRFDGPDIQDFLFFCKGSLGQGKSK